VLFLNQ